MGLFCFHTMSIFGAEAGRVPPVVFLLGAAFFLVAASGVWVCGRFKPSVTVKAGSSASASSNGPKGTAASSPGKRSALRLTEHSKPSVSARIAKKPRERKSADAPVIMSVYKYSEEAQDWLYQTREAGKTLYACILGHDAYPSVCFGLVDRLGRFLAENAANGYPGNLAALREAGIALVLTKNEDPDQVGYVAYRPVFYVVGDLENFLVLFDEFMAFAAREPEYADRLAFTVEPHADVDLRTFEAADKEHGDTTIHQPAMELTHGVFSVYPPNGPRLRRAFS